LSYDRRYAPFTILGVETDVKQKYTVHANALEFETTLGGRIDRLDCKDGRIRVVDYKTGAALANVNAVENIFKPLKTEKHSDYYLQTLLYSTIVSDSIEKNPKSLPVAPALFYIQRSSKDDYNPMLSFKEGLIMDIKNSQETYMSLLSEVINEIFDSSVPFKSPTDESKCKKCAFAKLCGRQTGDKK
jgi:CRISPR/Cas system-associated exonuclease Cas4 (RecB family)